MNSIVRRHRYTTAYERLLLDRVRWGKAKVCHAEALARKEEVIENVLYREWRQSVQPLVNASLSAIRTSSARDRAAFFDDLGPRWTRCDLAGAEFAGGLFIRQSGHHEGKDLSFARCDPVRTALQFGKLRSS